MTASTHRSAPSALNFPTPRRLSFAGSLVGRLALLGVPALGALAVTAMPATASAQALRSESGPYEIQVLVGGAPAQSYYHNGETYVLGQHGDRYTLRVINRSGRRIEAVVSVDGKDVVDGRSADYRSKRGYLVPAYGTVDIDGWRVTRGEAAAFRFSTVANSYAGRTGSARDVGVIGVAVFPERYNPPRPVYTPYYPPPPPPPYYGYRAGDAASGPAEEKAKKEYYDGPRAAPKPASPPMSAQGSSSAPAPEAIAPRDDAYGGALAERERRAPTSRPGLGTSFGERVDSPIREVSFVRQSATVPSVLLGMRYNDYDGLVAMGVDMDGPYYPYGDVRTRQTATPFPTNDRRYATPPPGWDGR